MVKKIFPLIIVLFSSIIAGFYLLHSGLPPTHDGEYHIVRFYEFNKAFLSGDLYPRWAADLNNGFGVPLFNYVYPLSNYFASLLHMLGFSFIDSFKIEMFLSFIIGGIFFYLWSREFWGDLGGVVSSVFYTFSPYRFVDVYIRGSIGECLAFAIFPALLWSITVFIKTRRKFFFPLSSLLFALLIFSHNILALMFSVFLFLYIAVFIYKNDDKKRIFIDCLRILILGFCLSSIFWLPALFEKKYVVGLEVFNVSNNFPLLYQLLIPTWGSGFSGGELGSEMSFQLGIANLLVVFTSFLFLIFSRKKDNNREQMVFFVCSFMFIFFLMLEQSAFIWETVPLMNYYQFPWRFLSLEIIIASFLAGGVIYRIKFKKISAILFIFIAVSLGIGYAKPAYYLERNDSYYTTRSNFIDGTNSPGNTFNTVWFKKEQKEKDKVSIVKGSGQIKFVKIKNTEYILTIITKQNSQILVNTSYFPGWNVYVDKKKVETFISEEGLFYFDVSKGEHRVRIKLEDTGIRRIGALGFYISLFIILFLFRKAIFVTIKK